MTDINTLLERAGLDPKMVTAADPLVVSAEAATFAVSHNDARNAADYLPPKSTPFMAGLALGLALSARAPR